MPPPALHTARLIGALGAGAAATRESAGPFLPPVPLQIVDAGPRGRAPQANELHVRFSEAMVPLDQCGESDSIPSWPPGQALPLVISPPLAGHAYFQTPERLVYRLTDKPRVATRYRVQLSPPLSALGGGRWAGMPTATGEGAAPYTWEFETERPMVESVLPDGGGDRRSRTAPLFVRLQQRTALSQVVAHLRARVVQPGGASKAATLGATLPLRVTVATHDDMRRANVAWASAGAGERPWFMVQPQGLWPQGATVRVQLLPGWVSEEGPLPADTPWETEFRVVDALRLSSANCTAQKPCAQEAIVLRFTNPIATDGEKQITVTPRPEHLSIYRQDSYRGSHAADEDEYDHSIEILGAFLPGQSYRVTVRGELRDDQGQTLGASRTLTAVFTRRPMLELSSERGILRAGQEQTVGVQSRHVAAIEVRAQILDDQQVAQRLIWPPAKASKADSATRNAENEEAAEGSAEGEDEAALPAPQPQFVRRIALQPHGPTDWSSIALDLNDLVGGARGALLLEVVPTALVPMLAKSKPPRPVRGLFRLTDLGVMLTASRPRTVVAVNRLSDGQPVGDAQVGRMAGDGKVTPLGRTDSGGLLTLTPPDDRNWAQARALYVVTSAQGGDGSRLDRSYLVQSREGYDPEPGSAGKPRLLRRGERVLSQLVTERDAYRPAETVHIVGFSAIESPYVASNLRRVAAGLDVDVSLLDTQRKVVGTRRVQTTGEGKFFTEIPIPAGAPLGGYRIEASLLGRTFAAYVKVQDYRVPEYAVNASPDQGEVIHPKQPQIRIAATYFFGGEVAVRGGSASQHCRAAAFRPPGLGPDWRVGTALDAATVDSGTIDLMDAAGKAAGTVTRRSPGRLQFVAPPLDPHGDPLRCVVSVSIADASYQRIGAETGYLQHPARYYLAAQIPKGTLEAGDALVLPVRAVTPEGQRVAAAGVKAQIEYRHDERIFVMKNGQRVFDRVEEQRDALPLCPLSLTAEGVDATCRIAALRAGTYVVRLRGGPDAAEAETEVSIYVRPREPKIARPAPPPPPPHLSLWFAQTAVKPGDVLEGRISAPWPIAGTLILAKQGIRQHIPFAIRDAGGGSVPVSLRVDDSWVPSMQLQVIGVTGPRVPVKSEQRVHRSLPATDQPKVQTVQAQVTVEREGRRLQVQVDAPTEATAGQRVPVRVQVRDGAGTGTPARVALWAVDEAVLSLTNYDVPDLLPTFIPGSDPQVDRRDEYGALLGPYHPFEDPWLMPQFSGMSGYGSGHGGLAGSASHAVGVAIQSARQRFETTPLFLGDVATDASGAATVQALLPDNLTTFRITAIASARLVDGESPGRFGKGDTRLRVTQPLIVRAALPRMLRPGDRAELGALLNNLGGPAGTARVDLVLHQDAARPVVRLDGPAQAVRELTAGDVVRVPFLATALRTGTVEIELRGTLQAPQGATGTSKGGAAAGERAGAVGVWTDALRVPLAVTEVPRVQERVAMYGTLDDAGPVAIALQPPAGARRDEGGLTITTSPSLLRDLDGAARSLVDYPYGCLEQTTSRLVPLIALADVGALLPRTDGQAASEAARWAAFVQAGLERIASMQTAGGGFAYWPGGREPHLYATAYATWVLHQLQQSLVREGAQGPAATAERRALIAALEPLLVRAGDYLLRTLVPVAGGGADDGDVGNAGIPVMQQGQLDLVRSIFALQVLAESGREGGRLGAVIDALYARRAAVPIFARALLLSTLHALRPSDPRVAELTDEVLSAVGELPGSARVTEAAMYGLGALFYSSARSDAMVLSTLLRVRPQHPIIPKLARGLLSRRTTSAWRNTQENAYAILALSAYGRVFEAVDPQLDVRAWVGSHAVGGGAVHFASRAAPPSDLRLPMPKIFSAREGDGGHLLLQREGQGRLYYRVELSWVPQQPLRDLPARSQGLRVSRALRTRTQAGAGVTSLMTGEAVAMDLQIENDVAIDYVAIDVPLPAGLEALQREVGFGQASMRLPGTYGPFVSHEELRADRVVVFADRLHRGVHKHTIYLRPTTPGQFVLPSAQAEAMYEPELYGRTTMSQIEIR